MGNDMLDKNGIKEDLINFINIIKNFDNQYNNIKHEEIDYMEYEAMDYDDLDLDGEYEIATFDNDINTKEIPDTWLEEIEFFTEQLNIISTENLILINKIINLGKDLMKNEEENDKVIFIKNKYLNSSFIGVQRVYYEDRDEIIEDLFSKKGEKLIKWIELGIKKLEF